MSQSKQGPRNGLAKLLSEADPDAQLADVTAEKDQFECPECGWTAELRRNECMVCEFDRALRPVHSRTDGDA